MVVTTTAPSLVERTTVHFVVSENAARRAATERASERTTVHFCLIKISPQGALRSPPRRCRRKSQDSALSARGSSYRSHEPPYPSPWRRQGPGPAGVSRAGPSPRPPPCERRRGDWEDRCPCASSAHDATDRRR